MSCDPSVQIDLGHPPVARLSDIEGGGIAAVDGIDAAEVAQALAGLPELAHHRAVQFQLEDLAATIEIVGWIGVGAEQILVRARSDADGFRIAAAGDAALEVAVIIEHLDTVVAAVGDIDIA